MNMLPWSNSAPGGNDASYPRCEQCRRYIVEQGGALVGACASVGIEHGMSTAEMVAVVVGGYHERGHRPI